MELVAIDKPPKSNEIFHDIDKDGDGRLSEDEVRMFMTLFVDSTLYSSFHVYIILKHVVVCGINKAMI